MYNRSVNKLKYLSVAVNALKRLKNQTVVAAKGENLRKTQTVHEMSIMLIKVMYNSYLSGADENEVNSQRFRGNIPLNPKKCKGNGEVNWFPLNAFRHINILTAVK